MDAKTATLLQLAAAGMEDIGRKHAALKQQHAFLYTAVIDARTERDEARQKLASEKAAADEYREAVTLAFELLDRGMVEPDDLQEKVAFLVESGNVRRYRDALDLMPAASTDLLKVGELEEESEKQASHEEQDPRELIHDLLVRLNERHGSSAY